MSVIERTEIVKYVQCDFCDRHTGNGTHMSTCAICGKDICNNCPGESCEDGTLCPICSKTYEFDPDAEYGSVGIIDKITGIDVDAPYL